jgi:hypothetical protein
MDGWVERTKGIQDLCSDGWEVAGVGRSPAVVVAVVATLCRKRVMDVILQG